MKSTETVARGPVPCRTSTVSRLGWSTGLLLLSMAKLPPLCLWPTSLLTLLAADPELSVNAPARGWLRSGSFGASAYAYGIPINHHAANGWRITLFLEMSAKEGHVLHVGPE